MARVPGPDQETWSSDGGWGRAGRWLNRPLGEDYSSWSSNARCVTWPNYSDLLDYLELNNYPRLGGREQSFPRAIIWALDAAVSRIAERCQLDVRKMLPPVTWQVNLRAGLARLWCPARSCDPVRVGAEVRSPFLPAGTVVESVVSGFAAYLSEVAAVPVGSDPAADMVYGVPLTVGPVPAQPDELAEIPPHIFEATLLQASRWYRRRQASEGIQGASELGGAIRYGALDSDVELMLTNELIWGLA